MLSIRKANPQDADRIAAIVNAAFEFERDFRYGDRTSPTEIVRLVNDSAFLLALRDNRIVGAVHVRVTGPTGYFGMLSVDPDSQRAGIGRFLVDAAEAYCRDCECERVTLTTGHFRTELLAWYGKLGYQTLSVDPAPPDAPFFKPIQFVKMAKPL